MYPLPLDIISRTGFFVATVKGLIGSLGATSSSISGVCCTSMRATFAIQPLAAMAFSIGRPLVGFCDWEGGASHIFLGRCWAARLIHPSLTRL
jgi:hypothetical protein